ncbi:hypothetical protein BGW80DRAFT_1247647 [Lactifluus volemus]|nr:hypothetical protein BGW80DRAFT_1247647 [Lactifluus volemus]
MECIRAVLTNVAVTVAAVRLVYPAQHLVAVVQPPSNLCCYENPGMRRIENHCLAETDALVRMLLQTQRTQAPCAQGVGNQSDQLVRQRFNPKGSLLDDGEFATIGFRVKTATRDREESRKQCIADGLFTWLRTPASSAASGGNAAKGQQSSPVRKAS